MAFKDPGKKIEEYLSDPDLTAAEKQFNILRVIDTSPDYDTRVALRARFKRPLIKLAKRILDEHIITPENRGRKK